MSQGFRCAAASLARSEPLLGTASVVKAYVLVEHPGPWGRTALRDASMSEGVRRQLTELSRLGVKTLLIRRHGRSPVGSRRVLVVWAGSPEPWIETTELRHLDDLEHLDLAGVAQGGRPGLSVHSDPLVCVCTHGRHDACCAELGRPLAKALQGSYSDLVWEVSHIGGDRFAGNVVLMPMGLYYGRVTADSAPRLVEEYLAGRVDLDHFRGRSTLAPAAQAAEILLRRRLGYLALTGLRLTGIERAPERWAVTFEVDGVAWRCDVAVGKAEPTQLTCSATRTSPAPTFTGIDIARLG